MILGFLLWLTNGRAEEQLTTIKLDWAYYNPLSLVLKEKRWLEDEFKSDGIEIEWTQSLGSNKALELLRSRSIDFGSTAGAAALLGRANGNPIKSIMSKVDFPVGVGSTFARVKGFPDKVLLNEH